MQDLPVVHTDTDVAALVVLIAIEATKVFERTIAGNLHLIAIGNADATGTAPLVFGGALVGASFDKAVFAQFLLYLPFAFVLKLHNDTISCEQIFVLVETDKHGTSYGPGRTVGGTRIPRQGEEVTTGNLHTILMDDAFYGFVACRVLSLLERTIEIKTVHLPLALPACVGL